MTQRLLASLATGAFAGFVTAIIIIVSNWLKNALGDVGVAIVVMVSTLAFLVVFVVDTLTDPHAA